MSNGPGPIDELAVPYDPAPTTGRLERYRRMVRSRLISLGITLVVLVAIGIWQHRNLGNPVVLGGYLLVVGVAVLVVLVSYLLYRRARRPLATLGAGVALRIDRWGVELAGRSTPWSEVSGLAVRPGPWGLSPVLEVARRSAERISLPLDQIGTRPATIDSVARAYSSGRHGVDLSELDS